MREVIQPSRKDQLKNKLKEKIQDNFNITLLLGVYRLVSLYVSQLKMFKGYFSATIYSYFVGDKNNLSIIFKSLEQN